MEKTPLLKTSAILLGGGSIAFAAWALAHPASFARAMGIDRQHARLVGLRDVVSGFLILGHGGAGAYAVRAALDASDAAMVARTRPRVAIGAACFAACAAAAAVAASRKVGSGQQSFDFMRG